MLVSFSRSLQFLYPGARVQIIQDSIEPLPLSTFNRELTSDDLLKKKRKENPPNGMPEKGFVKISTINN